MRVRSHRNNPETFDERVAPVSAATGGGPGCWLGLCEIAKARVERLEGEFRGSGRLNGSSEVTRLIRSQIRGRPPADAGSRRLVSVVSRVPEAGSVEFAQDGLGHTFWAAWQVSEKQPQVLRLVPARRDSLRMTSGYWPLGRGAECGRERPHMAVGPGLQEADSPRNGVPRGLDLEARGRD